MGTDGGGGDAAAVSSSSSSAEMASRSTTTNSPQSTTSDALLDLTPSQMTPLATTTVVSSSATMQQPPRTTAPAGAAAPRPNAAGGGARCDAAAAGAEAAEHRVDFIGSSRTVKDLFALPYGDDAGAGCGVALHNLGGGTLLLDRATGLLGAGGEDEDNRRGDDRWGGFEVPPPALKRRHPSMRLAPEAETQALQSVPTSEPQPGEDDGWEEGVQSSLALSAVSSVLRTLSTTDDSEETVSAPSWTAAPTRDPQTTDWVFSDGNASSAAGSTARPVVEDEPPTRQYLSWQFHEMRLLVASDALIYRPSSSSATSTPTPTQGDSSSGGRGSVATASEEAAPSSSPPPSSVMSQALTVRMEDVGDLRRKLAHHERMVRDRRAAVESSSSSSGALSYAEAVASSSPPDSLRQRGQVQSDSGHEARETSHDQPQRREEHPEWSLSTSAGSFGLRQMQLQTCVLPSEATTAAASPGGVSTNSGGHYPSTMPSPSSSPIYTCLDAYLDNIMANVPQLALCLQERGFVRSVKLLRTEDIPSSMIHSSTLSIDDHDYVSRVSGGPGGGDASEPVFSPSVVDLNATMLLRFLKENCTSENSTYLLHREPGQPNIHLYDVTSISSHRQRKWTRWLAMMSYRFATKLAQHSSAVEMYHASSRRNFRDRQRSLLRTSLDLLEELADMDGGTAHETICAAVNEQLADTYLSGGGDGLGHGDSGGGRERTYNEPTSSASAPPPPANGTGPAETRPQPTKEAPTTPTSASSQPYDSIAVDALNKAQDFLLRAIRTLWPLLERAQGETTPSGSSDEKKEDESGTRIGQSEAESSSPASNRASASSTLAPSKRRSNLGGGDVAVADGAAMEVEALCTQLCGLHHKLVNVSLRLAQHHFKTYWSSSAMQALRMSARRLADYVSLLETLGYTDNAEGKEGSYPPSQGQVASVIESVQYQYAWLWEYCGHFARSFAADTLWRERGHACGDDVIGLLRDVETACDCWVENSSMSDLVGRCELSRKTLGEVTLHSLKVLFSQKDIDRFAERDRKIRSTAKASALDSRSGGSCGSLDVEGVVGKEPAMELLEKQSQLKRDERRVLVAAALCYSRSIGTLSYLATKAAETSRDCPEGTHSPPTQKTHRSADGESRVESSANNHVHPGEFLGASNLLLLQKRYGDACNEIGKILLSLVRDILSSSDKQNKSSCGPLLRSAEFWFLEGLEHFVQCKDIRNIALLRCNLCQCCKIKANHHVAAIGEADLSTNAEVCLQEAADQLQLAHGALGQRDEDPRTWDMVSEELAATFLVLGVRRRQSLLGGGTMPVVAQALRLSPGKERSVVHPMEQALGIYEKLGNAHQAAAAHYQLALFFAKVWTCQRDEAKTREKLAAAFQHYHSAHRYFSSSMKGKEPTFVILSLDLSNLYSAVSGYECLTKALACCLDTCDAFSGDAVASANERNSSNSNQENEWFVKMTTLSKSIEERVFKLLLSLVKLEKECDGATRLATVPEKCSDKYTDMYRVALSTKMEVGKMEKDASVTRDQYIHKPLPVYTLLLRLREKDKLR